MVALIINNYLEGTGSNPVEALSFLGLLFFNWLNCSTLARTIILFHFSVRRSKKKLFHCEEN